MPAVTYTAIILPQCHGVASIATEQNNTFNQYYLNKGQVHYDPGGQRLDDLYGTLTSLSILLTDSTPDKQEKSLVISALDQYDGKKDRAGIALANAMTRSTEPKLPQDTANWYGEAQVTLNGQVKALRQAFISWNP